MMILYIVIIQSQDFTNLKTHSINLIISKSNETQLPQFKQSSIIVKTDFKKNDG